VTERPRDTIDVLTAARAAYAERAWSVAYQRLAEADKAAPLGADDLEHLATAAYLVGLDDEFFSALERAYHGCVSADVGRATRCAFWLGLCLLFTGKVARSSGWLARAQAHVDSEADLDAEAGLLLIPQIERQLSEGNWQSAQVTAKRAVDIGEKYGDADLSACARHQHGRALIGAYQVDDGFALLDQVMLEVREGNVSPIMTGLVYCSVIDACQQVYAVARAREWTDALVDWCEAQPQMIAFNGTCMVHRAELMQLSGKWPDALHEARRARERYAKAGLRPSGATFYQQAEVHRLRGDYEAAEEFYREASQRGFEPQPGLSLLRLAQGNKDVARGSIRRIVAASDDDPLRRARLLPACTEIMLAVGEIDAARNASRELTEMADRLATEVLVAIAAQTEAAVVLAEGDAQRALGLARRAFRTWDRVEAPYEAARTRILAGLACQELDDSEGARLEFEAAMSMLAKLSAAPELARVRALGRGAPSTPADHHGLTPRELEILQLVAAGKTNKVIAAELFVSDKTVERHLSNIFNKLDVSTRTAAAAYAYAHKLI
jgi:DNA-binding CsgD family transcriptional regulator